MIGTKILTNKIVFQNVQNLSSTHLMTYFQENSFYASEFSIGYLYMWEDYYQYKGYIENDFLFIYGDNLEGNEKTFFLPLSINGPSLDAIDLLLKKEEQLILEDVPEEVALEIQKRYNVQLLATEDSYDYVYTVERLMELKGDKLKKKKNLLRQFQKQNECYHVEKISIENLKEIKKAYLEWNSKEIMSGMKLYEHNKVLDILDHYDELPFWGVALYTDGRYIAFSFGEIMNDVCHVHVEKANTQYKGVYQAINFEFCSHIHDFFPKVVYLNREDDGGDEGLRKAKRSYNPVFIIKKYRVFFEKRKM